MNLKKIQDRKLYYFCDLESGKSVDGISKDELIENIKNSLPKGSEELEEIEKDSEAIWKINWDKIGKQGTVIYGLMNE